MSIDKKSPIPAYYQLMSEIKNKISSGIWPVGHCIDSERTLAEENNVSRMTVRQAIGELVQEGLLTREKGKGTFVCEPKLKQKNIMSFSEIMKNSGAEFKTQIKAFEKIINSYVSHIQGVISEIVAKIRQHYFTLHRRRRKI